MFARYDAKARVVGTTAALLLAGIVAPVGAPANTAASHHATTGIVSTAGPVTGDDGGGAAKGPSGDHVFRAPAHRGVLAGCITRLNC